VQAGTGVARFRACRLDRVTLERAFGACKTLQGHVEHYQDAPALVMQTRKGLHPILGPRNRIDPPGLGVSRIASRQGRRCQNEELG
jgi:hypothetical protein